MKRNIFYNCVENREEWIRRQSRLISLTSEPSDSLTSRDYTGKKEKSEE